MKKFFKNYWLIIFLTLIASSIIGIFFIKNEVKETQLDTNLETKKLLLIPSPKLKEYPIKITINYNYLLKNFPDIPQLGTVYSTDGFSFSDQEALKIAQNFGLKGMPEFKNFENIIYYDWVEPQKNLSINLTEGEFSFNNNNLNLDNILPVSLPNISQVDSVIKSILQEKELLSNKEVNLSIKNKSYIRSYGSEYGITSNPQEAFAIEVKLQYELKNIRLLENEITVLIGERNEILKLEYRVMPKNFQILDIYPLKNKEEIIKELKSSNLINYFKIINNYEFTAESQDINKIDLNKIELVYLKTEIPQSYLQPVFSISGQAILNDGRVAEIGIYLPAIKDEYLLK